MAWLYLRSCILIFSVLSKEHIGHQNFNIKTNAKKYLPYDDEILGDDYLFGKEDLLNKLPKEESKISLQLYNSMKFRNSKWRIRLNSEVLSDAPCYDRGLCKEDENKETATCHCDRHCLLFGDCCYDRNLDKVSHSSNLPKYEQLKCVTVRTKFSLTSVGFWMSVTCPDSYNDDSLSSQCDSGQAFCHRLPVWDDKCIVYYNAYCAMCNVSNVQNARISLDVKECFKDIADDMYYFQHSICKPVFLPPIGLCLRIFHKLLHTKIENHACRIYQNPIDKSAMYENNFCKDQGITNFGVVYRCCKCMPNEEEPLYQILPLTVLLTFSSPVIVKDESSSCNNCGIFNKISKTCMKSKCESELEPYEGLCQELPSFTNNEFKVNCDFSIDSSVDSKFLKRVTVFLFQSLIVPFSQLTPKISIFHVNNGLEIDNKSFCAEITANVDFNITYEYITLAEIEISKVSFLNVSWPYNEMNEFNGQTIRMRCNLNISRLSKCDVKINNTPVYEKTSSLHSEMFDKVENTHLQPNKEKICSDATIATLLKTNKTVKIISWSCQKASLQTPNQKQLHNSESNNIHKTLTYICMGILCAVLIILISIYGVLSFESRSENWSTLVELSINMLKANIIFIIGIGIIGYQDYCLFRVFAVLYFWINFFSFTVVALLEITLRFFKIVEY